MSSSVLESWLDDTDIRWCEGISRGERHVEQHMLHFVFLHVLHKKIKVSNDANKCSFEWDIVTYQEMNQNLGHEE